MAQRKKKPVGVTPTAVGLAGFFGHVLEPDPNHPDQMMVNYQFRVLRPMDAERWVVQFYSFLDGTPNRLGVYAESFLLGPNVRLYPDEDTWHEGYEKDCEKYMDRRGY